MKRYEAYKHSGVEWIGEIPEGWEVRRIKTLFKEINERSFDGSEDLLSVSQYTGVTKKSDKVEEGDLLTNASTLEGYKIVRNGDLVSNIMLAWNGSLGFSQFDGITSPAYSIYRLKSKGEKQFFHYLFRTEKYKAEFKRQSSGVIESRLRLYSDDFFSIYSILPPLSEQTNIAQFLDDKTAKIDQTIAIRQKEIELLKERRQILTQQAVTKGLDATLPMKDSGVDWIGEIPEHWEVRKLKTLSKKIVDGTHFTPNYIDEGIPFLRVTDLTNMQSGVIQWEKVNRISVEEHKSLIKRAFGEKGDVLLSKNGTIGLTKVIDWDEEFSFFVSLCLIKLRKEINPHYFTYFFNSPLVDEQLNFGSSRTSVTNLHLEKIKELLIVLPPINEQDKIIKAIDELTNPIAKAIRLKEQEIEKLKEYKTVLIEQVVKGKVRVSY